MIHKYCVHCKKIGHVPELEQYLDPGYLTYPFRESKKYGIKWYHRDCFKSCLKDFFTAIIEHEKKQSGVANG